eukprot:7092249-Lingulodinium_polyedra.AAC.1
MRGAAQERSATAIARAQQEAVTFAVAALDASRQQLAANMDSLASYPSGDAVHDVAESIMGGIVRHGADA